MPASSQQSRITTPSFVSLADGDHQLSRIANRVASDYLDRHGCVQWADVENGLRRPDPCPKLATYWTFHSCGYRKWARTCDVQPRLPHCIVPALPMRNGSLAQAAAALYLFLRDVCGGDFIGWIDDQLTGSKERTPPRGPSCMGRFVCEYRRCA